jgi:hypothetical protein
MRFQYYLMESGFFANEMSVFALYRKEMYNKRCRRGEAYMDVSGVSQTAGTSQTQEVQTTASTTESTSVGGGTVASLPKPLLDAICQAIAYNVCSASNRSNQRLHDIMSDADRQQR